VRIQPPTIQLVRDRADEISFAQIADDESLDPLCDAA